MHLLFDGQALQSPLSRNRGIGRYGFSLLGALRAARPRWRITVVEPTHLPPVSRDRVPDGLEFERLELPLLPFHIRSNRWVNDRAYGDWLAGYEADLFLTAHSFEFEGVHPLFGARRPLTAAILYDLIPQRFDDVYLQPGIFREFYTDRLRQTCDSDLLLAISAWTARDYEELQPAAPARVKAIGGAPDPWFQPLEAGALQTMERQVREKFGLRREFILNPSGQCWRKNSRGALLAFAKLPLAVRSQYDLVVACRMNRAEEDDLHRLAAIHGLQDYLRVTGFIDDDELRVLYQLCRLCIFPSFYEGLGLPVVEALQCGAPVVTSECSSLPEFAGPDSFLSDPADPDSMSAALAAALEEPRSLRESQRIAFARRFCWSDVAERAARGLEELLAAGRIPRPYRPRLAWVTSAPAASDELENAEQIIGELMHRYTVELVVPDEHAGISAACNCQVLVIRESELRERHRVAPFQYFLYDEGSTSSWPFLERLARQYPGVSLDQRVGPALLEPGSGRDAVRESPFIAYAVRDARRWAQRRAQVVEPVYLLDAGPGASDFPMTALTASLSAAIESLTNVRRDPAPDLELLLPTYR